jgi:hypothetical protein
MPGMVNDARIDGCSRNAKFGGTALYGLYDYLHIVSQSYEESHEALHGIASEPACQHRRYPGLIDSHEPGRGRLGQTPLPNGSVDLNHQASLDQVLAGVRQAKVREYVARTGLHFKSFTFRHSSPRFAMGQRLLDYIVSDVGLAIRSSHWPGIGRVDHVGQVDNLQRIGKTLGC